MISTRTPIPVVVATDPFMFWVGVATALGTIAAAAVAVGLGLSAARSERKRNASADVAELGRQAELQAVLIRVEKAGMHLTNYERTFGVIVRNQSTLPIYDVRVSASPDGVALPRDPTFTMIYGGVDQSVGIGAGDGSAILPEPQHWRAWASFTDAYGRKWRQTIWPS